MKKNLVILLVLGLLAGVAFMLNSKYGGSTTLERENSDFAVEDTASVNKIFLADKRGNTILLERNEDQSWTLNKNHKARMDAVKTLLETINRVTVKTPVTQSAFDQIVKNIATNSTKVEIYQGGEKPSKVYYVGGPNQEHLGTNMLIEGSSRPFVMHIEGFRGFLTPRYFTNENEWKSTKIFGYDYGKIKEIRLEYPKNPEYSFAIEDKGDHKDFKLTGLQSNAEIGQFDTTRVQFYLGAFKKVHFEGYEETKDEAFIDSVKASPPLYVFTITDFNDVSTEIKAFRKPIREGGEDLEGNPIDYDIDRLYALINQKDFVIIQYYVFDPITPKLADFIPN